MQPETVQQAFGLKRMPRRVGPGACQPYPAPVWLKRAMLMLLAFVAINVALAVMAFGSGKLVAEYHVNDGDYLVNVNADGHLSPPFEVSDETLVQVKMTAPVSNSWVFVEGQLLDEDLRRQLAFTEEMSYYHGRSGGESWSEGSRSDSKVFRVDKPGTYHLAVGGEAGRGNASSSARRGEPVTVRVYEDVMLARYYVLLAALGGVGLVVYLVLRGRFEAKRFGVTDDD
jgi:hypothetical protein